jgi:hypothetical protein
MASLASINIRFAVDLKQFSTEMQNSLRTIDKVGQKFQAVGRNMSAYVTLPILAAGAASVKLASDYNESLNKVDVSFKTSANVVKEFSKTTLESFGIASGTALDMASTFGDMGTSMGLPTSQAAKMSTSLVGLAGDLASFKNISIDVANTALTGIFSGETESLKKLGIVLTEVNLKQFALSSGNKKNYEQMSQAEKVQLRYNYILSVTKNAQGDFIRTQGGASNQMRIFQESLKQLGQQFGSIILPLFTKVITSLNGVIKGFGNLSEGTKTTIVVFLGVASAIGPLLSGIGSLLTFIPTLVLKFTALNAVIIANPYVAAALAIIAVGAAIYAFSSKTDAAVNSQAELNKAVEVGNKNAVQEVTALDKLYAAATNVKLSTDKRKGAIDQLQALYPAYFKNIDAETIKNGKAETSYNQLRNAIFNKSRAAAIDNQLQLNANARITKEIELQDKLAVARKNLDNVQKNGKDEIISTGTGTGDTYFSSKAQQVKAAALALKNIKTELADFTASSLKSDESLLNAKQIYDAKSAKLSESEIARIKAEEQAMIDSAKVTEKSFKAGTIAFYDKQIDGLKNLQKEIPVTNAAWKTYEIQIDAIQKKIDAIQSPSVKLPKPQLSTEVDFEAPALNIPYYEEQIARYKVLQDQFSTNNEEGRAKYQTYADAISNTELIIQDIKGGENIPVITENINSLTDAQTRMMEISSLVGQSVSDAFSGLTDSLINSFGLAKNGFEGFIGGLLQTVTKLIAMMLASAISQSIAGATSSGTATGPAAVFTTPAFIATAIGGVLAAFAAIPKFETGGIVSGSSFYGDKILARLNSGELILNNKQQKAVYGAMNSAVNAGDVAVQIIGNLEVSGDKLQLIMARAAKRNLRTR